MSAAADLRVSRSGLLVHFDLHSPVRLVVLRLQVKVIINMNKALYVPYSICNPFYYLSHEPVIVPRSRPESPGHEEHYSVSVSRSGRKVALVTITVSEKVNAFSLKLDINTKE